VQKTDPTSIRFGKTCRQSSSEKQPMYEKYALTLTSFFVVMKEHFFPAGNPAGGLVTRTAYNYLGEGCMIVYLAVWTRFSSISNSVHRMYTQQ